MRQLTVCIAAGLCFAISVTAPANGADLLTSLKQFSDFPKVDVKQLMDGEILGQRGQLMTFPNGITTQTLYFVPASPEETARRLKTWDPTRCDSLKVYIARELKNPCGPADFASLDLSHKQHPVTWLLDKTLAANSGKPDLNMTRLEALKLAGCAGKNPDPRTVSPCWSSLLLERATAFQQKGVAGTLPYEAGEETVAPISMIRSMLQERTSIANEFAPLLHKAGLLKDGASASSLNPYYYWSFFDANHHATLSLGTVYQQAVDGHQQLLDLEYYVSGTYYTAATLYEIWPVQSGGKTGSLVWRGDFFAARVLRFTKGIERIAYGVLMIQEIKKDIRCFQNSVTAQP